MTTRKPSTFVCTITPFADGGTLDEEAAIELYGRLAHAGVGAYVASSSPGEGYALSLEETERLYGLALAAVDGRVPIRAMGVEPHTPEQLISLIRLAESCHLDAMQLYCLDAGHGNRPDPTELERYFRTLLETMSLPAVLSSHVFNGYVVEPDLVDRLLRDYPHIVGVNVTNPDIAYVAKIIDVVDGRADVHVGGPMQAVSALALGAQGFLGTEGNLDPWACAAVIEHYRAGNLDDTFAAYAKVIHLFSINTWPGGSMRWLKAAMKVLGLPGWHLRSPWLALDDAAHARIAGRLDALGVTADYVRERLRASR